jgi:hypothetical protein
MSDAMHQRPRWRAVTVGLAAGLMLTGCANAGGDRILSVPGSGLLGGLVYLDRDGDRVPGDADAALEGVRVRLIVSGTHDTVAIVNSGSDGVFAFGRVPVGRYTIMVSDEPFFGDSISVVRIDTSAIDLAPEDTVDVTVTVSFPLVSVAEARALTPGTKVFIRGVALNFQDVFADTVLHVRDTSAAIRITATQGPLITSGDTVRAIGRIGARDGQPVMAGGQAVILAPANVSQPAPVTVTSAQADTADGGLLDAQLVKIVDGTITDTATVNGDYVATVDSILRVVFDQDASLTITPFVPGVVIDATGVLVADGTGRWVLKPRTTATSISDVIVK